MDALNQLNVKQLRFILSQIPVSQDDMVLDVFMPYYKRTFPLVAYDKLENIEGHPATDQSPMVLITGPRPK